MINFLQLPPVTRAKAMALSPCPLELHKFLSNAGFAEEAQVALVDDAAAERSCDSCAREQECPQPPKMKMKMGR